MSTTSEKICLALETAVGAGSIAVLRGGLVIAESDSNEMRPSRAEELLGVIQEVMVPAAVGLHDIGYIAVSLGPGSYSGIRIGVSTAIGLKNAIGVEYRGVSLLQAIASCAVNDSESEVVVGVPVGKHDVAWQRFSISNGLPIELVRPALVSVADFQNAIRNVPPRKVRIPRDLLQRISGGDDLDGWTAVDEMTTLAALVGRFTSDFAGPANLTPIYLRSGAGF